MIDVARQLNSFLRIDPNAINRLFSHRVSCNWRLANHPTVQVRGNNRRYSVGVLGIINGLLLGRGGSKTVVVARVSARTHRIIGFASKPYRTCFRGSRETAPRPRD
jgi:hypothetical protein